MNLSIAVKRDPPQTVEQAALIVMAEFEYWKKAGDVSAMGACGNIYAALTLGLMAPWHPGYEEKQQAKEG